ncbi:apolipoprotein N-acyltransferase [Actinoallomurus purpureus]|uniref:apolipoprotein N-acyltransferase n=1 Tax=Actinoallomurus purpureus TaxID=478114 RepID=UPI00209332F7|nr:apolipoprotein N-acyltransferase [Actinoallomurus purpureus]MCO6004217.1 apolipoprotein N-acyltransferase [Actinoallomurus purpureus]
MAQEMLAEKTPGVAERDRASRVPAWLPRPAGVVAAGLLLAAAFPPIGWWPLAPVATALLALLLRGRTWRRGAGLGMLFGLAFCFPTFEGLRPVGLDAWIALSIFEALYFALLGAGLALVTRLRGWPVWTAAAWITEEFIRGRVPFGGFPWARLAFSQSASPFTGYASVGGAPLLSFVTALTGGLLAAAVLLLWRRRTTATEPEEDAVAAADGAGPEGAAVTAEPGPPAGRPVRWAALALAGVLALGLIGVFVPRPTGGRAVTVAVVQGNVPQVGLDFLGQRQAVLNNHARETHRLAEQVRAGKLARPDLVIWPENSSDLDPYADAQARGVIDAAVRDIGVPVLVGAVIDAGDGEHVENRGIVWDPAKGPGAYYVKRHPLPFGEYIPIFRGVLRKLITRFDRVGEFVKGRSRGSLQLGPVKIGDVICFEVAYDGIVRDVADAPLLVVQTNNATFGRTSLPPQQFAMSRLRAVEHGRSMLVASTSGISGIIAPDGRVLAQSKEFTPDLQVRRVPLRTSRTLTDHLGAAPEWVLALLGLAAAVAAAWRTRTSRGA